MKASPGTSLLDARTRFRVQLKHAVAIGPGKAAVLQALAHTGSIAQAARQPGMSHQRVWLRVRAMNGDFVASLVQSQRGGSTGGGARLTATGVQVPAVWRAIEGDAARAVARRLPQRVALMRPEAADRW